MNVEKLIKKHTKFYKLKKDNKMNAYNRNGFTNKESYFDFLSSKYNIDKETIRMLSFMYSAKEDFGQLVTHLENLSSMEEY